MKKIVVIVFTLFISFVVISCDQTNEVVTTDNDLTTLKQNNIKNFISKVPEAKEPVGVLVKNAGTDIVNGIYQEIYTGYHHDKVYQNKNGIYLYYSYYSDGWILADRYSTYHDPYTIVYYDSWGWDYPADAFSNLHWYPVEGILPVPETSHRKSIKGYYGIGDKIKAYYDYYDPNGYAEGRSIYKWYRSKYPNKPGEIIEDANSTQYTIQKEDYGKYLYFSVIPVNNQGVSGIEHVTKKTEKIFTYFPNSKYVQYTNTLKLSNKNSLILYNDGYNFCAHVIGKKGNLEVEEKIIFNQQVYDVSPILLDNNRVLISYRDNVNNGAALYLILDINTWRTTNPRLVAPDVWYLDAAGLKNNKIIFVYSDYSNNMIGKFRTLEISNNTFSNEYIFHKTRADSIHVTAYSNHKALILFNDGNIYSNSNRGMYISVNTENNTISKKYNINYKIRDDRFNKSVDLVFNGKKIYAFFNVENYYKPDNDWGKYFTIDPLNLEVINYYTFNNGYTGDSEPFIMSNGNVLISYCDYHNNVNIKYSIINHIDDSIIKTASVYSGERLYFGGGSIYKNKYFNLFFISKYSKSYSKINVKIK